jgi:hypothetical protein
MTSKFNNVFVDSCFLRIRQKKKNIKTLPMYFLGGEFVGLKKFFKERNILFKTKYGMHKANFREMINSLNCNNSTSTFSTLF